MTIICVKEVVLECRTGSTDKVYVLQQQLDDHTGSIRVVGFNGRRGSTLKEQKAVYEGTSISAAEAAFNKLERSKRAPRSSGSYTDWTGLTRVTGMPSTAPVPGASTTTTSSVGTVPARSPLAVTGPGLMRAEEVLLSEVEPYNSDNRYAAQQKFDGERVAVTVLRTGITCHNLKGVERPLPQEVIDQLDQLTLQVDFNNDRASQLDGELMGTSIVFYDLLMLRDNDYRPLSFDERYSSLELLLENFPHMLASTAFGTDAKRQMLAQAQKENWEGLMYRDLDSSYVGSRTTNILKCKLWASCTARVLTHNASRSIGVGLLDEQGEEQFCGNVTVPANQEVPPLDSLVEVRYLYALPGGSLYQPVLLGVRNDKDEADYRSSIRNAPPERLNPSDSPKEEVTVTNTESCIRESATASKPDAVSATTSNLFNDSDEI